MIRRLLNLPVLLITSHLPESGAAEAMLADCADDFFDVFATKGDLPGFHRLRHYLLDDPLPDPLPAPWREKPGRQGPELFDMLDEPREPTIFDTPSDVDPDAADPP